MTSLLFHAAFVVLLVGTEAFFTGLSILNRRYEDRTLPQEREWVEEELGLEDTDAILDYHRAQTGVSLLQSWVTLAGLLLVLYAGILTDAVTLLQSTGLSPLAQGVVFFAGVIVVQQVVSVPFDLVNTFVVEEIWGFNNQSPRLWLRDQVVGLVVGLAIALPLAAAVLWFVGNVPLWPAAAWGLFVAFVLAFMIIKPRVIDPLFYDFTKIESGDLRAAVDDVFERAGFACDQVYEMDASKRSSHSNAYFVGFGRTKRVVLFDTLIEDMELDEIKSVLAHELAHWKKGHIWKFVGLAAAQYAVVFAVLGVLVGTEWLTGMFGVPAGADYAALFLGALWILPVNRLVSPLDNHFSLKYERQADRFAVETMDAESMAGALTNLAAENLATLFPHPLYETFHYNHPPIPERIRYIRAMGEGDGETDAPSGAAGAAD